MENVVDIESEKRKKIEQKLSAFQEDNAAISLSLFHAGNFFFYFFFIISTCEKL